MSLHAHTSKGLGCQWGPEHCLQMSAPASPSPRDAGYDPHRSSLSLCLSLCCVHVSVFCLWDTQSSERLAHFSPHKSVWKHTHTHRHTRRVRRNEKGVVKRLHTRTRRELAFQAPVSMILWLGPVLGPCVWNMESEHPPLSILLMQRREGGSNPSLASLPRLWSLVVPPPQMAGKSARLWGICEASERRARRQRALHQNR